MPIDRKKVEWDAPAAGGIDAAAVHWDAPPATSAPEVGVLEGLGAGALRGAKDVIDTGAQFLASGFDKIAGTSEGARVEAMNAAGKSEFDKQYGGSTAAEVGRVGGQIAATLPVGGALGAGVRAAGAVGGIAPSIAVPLGEAIASGGLRAGGAGLGIRAAGGAIGGGAMAGAVDPASASTGAVVGAALPAVVRGLGAAGQGIVRGLRGPDVADGVRAAAEAGQAAGYVVPPTQVRPSLVNRTLEGFAGKLTTAQNASARNQPVTNELARKAIGAADLSPESLASVRSRANQAYDLLGKSAPFQADDAFRSALERASGASKQMAADFPELRNAEVSALVEGLAGRGEFGAQSTIEAVKQLRFAGSGNKGAMDPAKRALGSAQMKVAGALEDLIERNLERGGAPELLTNFRDARTTLAKVYDIEKALNPASGNVDAAKLAQLLKKGRPLTGELKTAAEFGAQFPKAVNTPERMGSLPQSSPLDWAAALGVGAATGGSPIAALGLVGRPFARAAALSGPVQRGLAQEPGAPLALGLSRRQEDVAGLLGRSASVGLSTRDR